MHKKLIDKFLALILLISCSIYLIEAHNPGLSTVEFDRILKNIQSRIIDPDAVSLSIWKVFIDDIHKIETQGSAEQQAVIQKLLFTEALESHVL